MQKYFSVVRVNIVIKSLTSAIYYMELIMYYWFSYNVAYSGNDQLHKALDSIESVFKTTRTIDCTTFQLREQCIKGCWPLVQLNRGASIFHSFEMTKNIAAY